MERLKVLFHINELERWDTALGNIINLLKDVGEDAVDAVVLANGPSVNAYGNDNKLSVMKGLSEMGVFKNESIFLAASFFTDLSRESKSFSAQEGILPYTACFFFIFFQGTFLERS